MSPCQSVGRRFLDQSAAQTLASGSTPARGDREGARIRPAILRPRDPPTFSLHWLVLELSTDGCQTGMERTILQNAFSSFPLLH